MMKKALWALALLFLVSGCDDNDDYQSPTRPDRLVNTTFNFEYNLNYMTENETRPAAHLTAPAMPSTVVVFRVVLELYEVVEDPANPGADPIYKFYGRKEFFTNRHQLGQNGNLVLEGEMRLPKLKYVAVVWGDYVLDGDNRVDRNFRTDQMLAGNQVYNGLRYVVDAYPSAANSSYISEGAFGGVHNFGLTQYEDDPIAHHTENISMSRKIGGIYLVADDLEEYVAQATAERPYDEYYKPTRVNADFGIYDPDNTPNAGYPYTFDVVSSNVVTSVAENVTKRYNPGEAMSANKVVIANFFLFAGQNKTKQDMTVTVYGPQNGKIVKFDIKNLPLQPNKVLYVEGPFLTGEFEGSRLDDDYQIRIVDRFESVDEKIATPSNPNP